MKLQVAAKYNDITHRFDIEVGQGDQTFKWLGKIRGQSFSNGCMACPHEICTMHQVS